MWRRFYGAIPSRPTPADHRLVRRAGIDEVTGKTKRMAQRRLIYTLSTMRSQMRLKSHCNSNKRGLASIFGAIERDTNAQHRRRS